ncbi:hypothetical protein [Thalassotalea atypica]|uniref:hypothetical protein n=1 Tax=Thalassotalea atypica TaxID=2054316 RepID=UPI0025743EC1|nr:hypothetical protein [Thalassotalea atypica]
MTKFDVLIKVYGELIIEFQSIEGDLISQLVASWETSLKQIDDFINTQKVKKSQIVSGLEQGLREIPDILSDLPSPIKEEALKKFNSVVVVSIPNFR